MIDAFGIHKMKLFGQQKGLKFYAKTFVINQVHYFFIHTAYIKYEVFYLFGFGNTFKEMCCRSFSGDSNCCQKLKVVLVIVEKLRKGNSILMGLVFWGNMIALCFSDCFSVFIKIKILRTSVCHPQS